MAVNALYASLFLPDINNLILTNLPADHRNGPDYINISRIGHLAETLALSLAERSIHLINPAPNFYHYAEAAHQELNWPTQLTITPSPNPQSQPFIP